VIEELNGLDELPHGWIRTQLSEVAEIILGQSPPSSTYNEDREGLPFYQGKLEFGKLYPTPRKWCMAPKKIAEQGDVLISVRAPVGPTNICQEKSCIGRGLAAIRGLGGIGTFFILYVLRALESEIARKGTGTTFSAIGDDKLKTLEIPLPPFNEQVRIVARLEELFTRLDAGVEGLRKVKAQLKRYRQAVLKYAFEGKLTEEWRKTHRDQIEPATKLLERIKQERKQKLGTKYKEPPPIDASELPKLPENWAWTILGEVVFLSNERYNPTISEDERFVGLEHIQSGTGKLLGFGKSSETRSTKNRFKQGDLLYGKLRPYLNKVWVANFNGVCSTDILVFQKNDFISNEYIAACLLNQSFVEYTNQHMSGVQHPRVSYQVLSQYVIPLPPLLEQLEIAEEVQRSFSVADEVETAMEQNLKKAEFLRQSILKAAFLGKLVPQDPSDEPAEKLLERIKAERAKSKGEKVINKKKNKPKQLELSAYVE
jgi:type I restriction enzyme S subunit